MRYGLPPTVDRAFRRTIIKSVNHMETAVSKFISFRQFLEKSTLYQPFEIEELLETARPDSLGPNRWPKVIQIECAECCEIQPHQAVNREGTGRHAKGYSVPVEPNALGGRLRRGVIHPILQIRERGSTTSSSTDWMRIQASDADVDLEIEYGSGAGFLFYQCPACDTETSFAIEYDGPELVLFGRWPTNRPRPDEMVDKYLSEEDRTLYQTALLCMEHGAGIGAAAYFRRIVENLIHRLLRDIREYDLADDMDELEDDEISELLKTGTGKEKCEAAKKVLPESTTIGGHNPLHVLYATLSGDIHAGTDPDALENAADIQKVLDFLIEEVEFKRQRREKYGTALGTQAREIKD